MTDLELSGLDEDAVAHVDPRGSLSALSGKLADLEEEPVVDVCWGQLR